MNTLRPCVVVTAFLLLVCCGLYPALVTGAAQALFPVQASGSLIEQDGQLRGSTLIGQPLADPAAHPQYFWPRPSSASVDSATGVVVSSGSNLGPMSPALRDAVAQQITALRASGVTGEIPVDLVTRSASGLDPHLSVAAVEAQIPRVAAARGLPEGELRALVARHTEGRTLSLLGEPRVNVLLLNLALDARARREAAAGGAR